MIRVLKSIEFLCVEVIHRGKLRVTLSYDELVFYFMGVAYACRVDLRYALAGSGLSTFWTFAGGRG